MFLTEEQAAILIHDRSRIVTRLPINLYKPQEIRYELNSLRGNIYSCTMLDTGAKLFHDKFKGAFYLSGNHPYSCDVLSMYDHLDILEDYYSWFLSNSRILNKVEELEKRKSAYKQYKLYRLRQVP